MRAYRKKWRTKPQRSEREKAAYQLRQDWANPRMDDAAQMARLEVGRYLDERGIGQFADGRLSAMNVKRLAYHMAWRKEPGVRLRIRLDEGTRNMTYGNLVERGMDDYYEAETRLQAGRTIMIYDPRRFRMKTVGWA
jgi:hypothetical protein